ncbi:hypothetical protein Hypma_005801 [Hypsizygus marmoreus]|uniref:DUF4218 domain-containing protein n=1 Tax=Hypsizygus marmoreus TaxID=39966 RepID=A0A369KGD8_HYPMA|nr:hypothetical protein Hypma_005801 [Hypsizygus marmoreus]
MKRYPADNCLCTVCTEDGRNPLGSPQSRTIRSQHLKAQRARNLTSHVRSLEEETLLTTLSVREDSQGEDPLWRGWQGQLDDEDDGHRGLVYDRSWILEPLNRCRTIGLFLLNTTESSEQNMLQDIVVHLQEKIDGFARPRDILFSFPPKAPSDMYPGPRLWKIGPASIVQTVRTNAQILLYLEFLEETEQVLKAMKPINSEDREKVRKATAKIQEEVLKLLTFRELEWDRCRRSVPDPENLRVPDAFVGQAIWFNTDVHFQPLKTERPVVILGLFIMMVLNLFHHLVRSGCTVALHLLKAFMCLAFQETLGPELPTHVKQLVDQFPVDLKTARKLFELEPTVTDYICCPECFALYPVDGGVKLEDGGNQSVPQMNSSATYHADAALNRELPFWDDELQEPSEAKNLPYPLECNHRPTRDSPRCGARLVRCSIEEPTDEPNSNSQDGRQSKLRSFRPLRMYSHQSMKAWLSRLMSRPGMEHLMDEIWDRVRNHSGQSPMSDFWDATELQEFRGPDKKFFYDNPNNEGRYIFSLFVDWFNPLGNKQSGKVVSSGVIFMVCLNLPLRLRYKRENVYLVGLMPGPKSPRLQQVNHFLNILVDELLEFWEPGVFFSRTTSSPNGRLVRCAVVPLICDLGAVKKVSGQASHSATYFCSFCKLKLHDINTLDTTQWLPRHCAEHRAQANEWKNARTPKDQIKAFKRAGVRYTPLLKLPYWDPTCYVVIDTMHNLFLGLFHRHCHRIFGIDIKGVAEDGLDDADEIVASEEEKEKGRKMLYAGKSANQVKNALNKLTLQALYEEFLSKPCENRTKAQLIQALMDNISGAQPTEDDNPAATTKPKSRAILDKIVLEEVQADIAKTILPTWIGRAPSNIGSPGHGKLSADQWRTLCTIHLPITLTRLWTRSDAPESRRGMLVNFLDLVTAVIYGTPRQLSQKWIQLYEHYIFRYANGLFTSFPDITLVPNQHYALHLPTVLRRFGPTHAYWAFPFERYIGLLSDINTNRRSSEMEKTFMQTYCMGSNLRSLLSTNLLPPIIQTYRGVVDTAMGNDSRGSLMSDLMVFGPEAEPELEYRECKKTSMPSHYYRALLHRVSTDSSLHSGVSFIPFDQRISGRHVFLNQNYEVLKEIRHRGLRFSSHLVSSGQGDAFVLYKPFSGAGGSLVMGHIESVFVHRRATPSAERSYQDQGFVAIQRFSDLEASDQSYDPYRQFKHLRMRLLYSVPEQEIKILPIVDVVAHFASCPYDDPSLSRPCMAVVPLQRYCGPVSLSTTGLV